MRWFARRTRIWMIAGFVPGVLALTLTGQAQHRDEHDSENVHASDSVERAGHETHTVKDPHGREADSQTTRDSHEDGAVELDRHEIDEFGIRVETAGGAAIGPQIELAGEIVPNPDRFAHVVPLVGGVVRQVEAGLGDTVRAGDVMAVIQSRELSDHKSAYLAARERLDLERSSFEREERLWERSISSERDFLAAKQRLAEARIAFRSAEHKLHALGFPEAYLDSLPALPDVSFTRYEIRAPFDGIVVAKHITLGESVGDDTEIFSVVDLSRVWAILTVYQKDLKWVNPGVPTTIADPQGNAEPVRGTLSYVSRVIDEATRTASARVVMENPSGTWRPGMFINAKIVTEGRPVDVAVPSDAIQQLNGADVVFVREGKTFHPRQVQVGEAAAGFTEIVNGLRPGEDVATAGAFTIRTQLEKSEFEAGHNH